MRVVKERATQERIRMPKPPKKKSKHSGGATPPPRSGRPVEHVVLLIKENHCFDNYFGTFPGANGMTMPRSPNPPPKDPDHRHNAWLTRETTAVRQQFVAHDIPAYFAYA